ncbi:MAG: GNAT family N-acetyltransferase [Myxococcales bacterium]|nr:GNAT family N-acetyltransferase [Myxococcales bacterium]
MTTVPRELETDRLHLRQFRDANLDAYAPIKDHVISLIDSANTPSIRVAERIGETLEGPQPFLGMVVQRYGIRREQYLRVGQE